MVVPRDEVPVSVAVGAAAQRRDRAGVVGRVGPGPLAGVALAGAEREAVARRPSSVTVLPSRNG